MTITSTAFQPTELIPPLYSCQGKNINPPLTFSEVPAEAGSLVLIVDDPDAPGGTFTHWLMYDLSPATMQILEHALPETGRQGKNDFGQIAYGGPCPPPGSQHRYYFRLYALNSMLHLPDGVNRADLDAAMENHILASSDLMGLFKKAI